LPKNDLLSASVNGNFRDPNFIEEELIMICRFTIFSLRMIVFALLTSFIISCSPDPKEATSENFTKAINEAIKEKGNFISDRIFDGDRKLFKSAGLIEIYTELEEKQDFLSFIERRKDNNPEMVEVEKYRLTELGKKYNKEKILGSGFCYGNSEVVEIKNFTEPTNMGGYTVSHVKYTFKINNIPEWVHVLKKKYKWMEKDINSSKTPLSGKATLILTNTGWVHETLFAKANS